MSKDIGPANVLRNHNSSNQQVSVVLENHESVDESYWVGRLEIFISSKATFLCGSNGIFCVFFAILLRDTRGKH